MLPRLYAAQQIEAIYAVAIGTGTMKKEESQGILRRLQTDLGSGQRRGKLSTRQHKAMLATMGVKLVMPDGKG